MSELDDIAITSAFTVAPEGDDSPAAIAGWLVTTCDEFEHLRIGQAVILFLFRAETQIKAQKVVLGSMGLPVFQGSLGKVATWLLAKVCGGLPDFIMILDQTFWDAAPPKTREALIFHELMHGAHAIDKEGEPRFTDEGNPIWAIRGHDLEEFNAVARRYGAWLPDIQAFLDSFETR